MTYPIREKSGRGRPRRMGIRYGIAETIGSRREMEDAHSVWDEEETGLFCAEVYDGHAGLSRRHNCVRGSHPLFPSSAAPGGLDRRQWIHGPGPEGKPILTTDRQIVDRGERKAVLRQRHSTCVTVGFSRQTWETYASSSRRGGRRSGPHDRPQTGPPGRDGEDRGSWG